MTTIRTVDVTPADTTGMKKLLTVVNLAKNPRGVNSSGVGGSSATGGASTLSYPTTGGPLTDAPTFVRRTIDTVPTGGEITITFGSQTMTTIDPAHVGKQVTLSVYVRASKTFAANAKPYLSVGWFTSAEGFISGAAATSVQNVANEWMRMTFTATVPANTARVQLQTTFPVAGFTGLAVGDTVDASALLIHEVVSGFDSSYFDGSSVGSSWQGTAHASRSQKVIGIG